MCKGVYRIYLGNWEIVIVHIIRARISYSLKIKRRYITKQFAVYLNIDYYEYEILRRLQAWHQMIKLQCDRLTYEAF